MWREKGRLKPQQADGYNVYFSIEIKRGGGINSVPAVLQPTTAMSVRIYREASRCPRIQ